MRETVPKNLPNTVFQGGILRALLRFSVPTTVAMLSTALYTLADAFFVSSLGTEAGAAVGVAFTVHALMQAVGYTFGMGGGSLLSRKLGEGDEKSVSATFASSVLLSLLIGTTILTIGLLFTDPLVRFLGATDSIYPLAVSYTRYLLFSAPFLCSSFTLSLLLRAEGRVMHSMLGLLLGSLCNVALDALLIRVFRLGISGAALATTISQAISAVYLWIVAIRTHEKSLFRQTRLTSHAWRIVHAGLPSLWRQGLLATATLLLNHASRAYGDACVAAISVVSRIFLLAFAFCLGIGQGMMPITGYYHGAKRPEQVVHAFRAALWLSTAVMLTLSIPLLVFAPQIIAFFRNDPAVIAIGSRALRAQAAVLALHGIMTCTIMLLQSIGRQFPASILAGARQGLFFLPLYVIMQAKLGPESILYMQPLADALSLVLALPFALALLKMPKEKIPLQGDLTRARG